MTWHNKVIWTEGMFLQPQHFQQHDRFLARQAHLRFSITQPYGWGFMSLSLDAASLTLGKIAIAGAHGVLPDGLDNAREHGWLLVFPTLVRDGGNVGVCGRAA